MLSHLLLVKNSQAQWIASRLEIIAEAEVPEHLEKRVVVSRSAHVIDIAGPQALLAGRGPGEFEFAATEKMVLELVHSGRGKQHRGIPPRHQHIARAALASLGFEKGQILFPQLIGLHAKRSQAIRSPLAG